MTFTKEQTARDEAFYKSVGTWKNVYLVILGNVAAYKVRLNELCTWDKSGTEQERNAKITALQILINQ